MKKLSTLLLLVVVAVSGCKKNDDNPPSDDDAVHLHQITVMTANVRAKFLELAPQVNGDPNVALIQTMDWLVQQEGIESAFHQDSVYLFFTMTNGLQSMVWVNELDNEGYSKFRGGGSGALKAVAADCNHEVANKDVLIYAPGNDEFSYEFRSQVPSRLQSSDLIDNVDYLQNEQASIAKISTFSDYGLVLMETHGTAIAFLTGDGFEFGQPEIPADFEQFSASILDQVGQQYLDYLIDGKLMIGGKVTHDPSLSNWWETNQSEFEAGKFKLWATSKFLEDQPQLSNTILFGNFCFSGWTTVVANYPKPIGLAFEELNPITYYAYQEPNGKSKSVDNLESMALEDSVIVGLLTDGDNTGVAHLKTDGTQFQTTWPELHLTYLGQPDWCYESCGEDLVHDGQTYRTVCIDDQVWMAENLRYLPVEHTNSQFADAADNQTPAYGVNPGSDINVHGVLYNWYAVNAGVCPAGWHLPSQEEWQQMAEFTGLLSEAGAKLKSQNYWGAPSFSTDEYGFSAVPAGSRGEFAGNFDGLGLFGYYWTSTTAGTGLAKTAGFSYSASSFQSGNQDKGAGYACRCVKDQ